MANKLKNAGIVGAALLAFVGIHAVKTETIKLTPAAAPSEAVKPKPELPTALIVGAGQALKAAARDPDSLVIENAVARSDGKAVCINYRARNGFGGMNRDAVGFDGAGRPHHSADWMRARCKGDVKDVSVIVRYGVDH